MKVKTIIWSFLTISLISLVLLFLVSQNIRKNTIDSNLSNGVIDPIAFTWHELDQKFENPIAVPNPELDGYWLLVLEKKGRVIGIPEDSKDETIVLLDISDRVRSGAGEQGLLDLVFDPEFASNNRMYISYTDESGALIVDTLEATDGVLLKETMTRIAKIPQPHVDHNGGDMAFLPDGRLLLGLGDGGKKGGDPDENAQNDDSVLGKIIAFNPSSEEVVNDDQIFSRVGNPSVWAKGLRNPWRFTFDPVYQGIFISDVGQTEREEVNFLPYSLDSTAPNFGWNYYEGSVRFRDGGPDKSTFTFPVVEYDHKNANCAVIGGEVYRGQNYTNWKGIYFYGDFCSGRIWGLKRIDGEWKSGLLFDTDMWITGFGTDNQGELYITGYGGEVALFTKRNLGDYARDIQALLKEFLKKVLNPVLAWFK